MGGSLEGTVAGMSIASDGTGAQAPQTPVKAPAAAVAPSPFGSFSAGKPRKNPAEEQRQLLQQEQQHQQQQQFYQFQMPMYGDHAMPGSPQHQQWQQEQAMMYQYQQHMMYMQQQMFMQQQQQQQQQLYAGMSSPMSQRPAASPVHGGGHLGKLQYHG